jgi:hypothetical protein
MFFVMIHISSLRVDSIGSITNEDIHHGQHVHDHLQEDGDAAANPP